MPKSQLKKINTLRIIKQIFANICYYYQEFCIFAFQKHAAIGSLKNTRL